jgi:hypothetical protein
MTVQKRLNQMLNFVVHINLILIRSKHLVKEEHILLWLPSLIIGYLEFNLLIIMYLHTFLYLLKGFFGAVISFEINGQYWSGSDEDTDVAFVL